MKLHNITLSVLLIVIACVAFPKETAAATANCIAPCKWTFKPLCAGFGNERPITYLSLCDFEYANCRANGTLNVIHRGSCTEKDTMRARDLRHTPLQGKRS